MATRLTDEFMGALQRFEATAELGPLLALFDDDGEALNLGRTEPARGTTRSKSSGASTGRCSAGYSRSSPT